MEFGEDYSQITYILNGPAIFVVFLVGGILNVVSICILLRKQQRKRSQDELSEVLSISEEKLLDLSSNYGSFCSEASKLDEKKQGLSPTLVWITCFEQILLTSTLLNYSIPTLFDLFSSYYATFIPLWYTISNSSSVAATWLLIISIIFVDYSLACGLRRRLLIIALFSLLISLPRYFELSVNFYPDVEEYIVEPTNLSQHPVYKLCYKLVVSFLFATIVPYFVVLSLTIILCLFHRKTPQESKVYLALAVKFLICRFPTVLIDFSEISLGQEKLYVSSGFVLFIHVSNFLVALSCAGNFFVFIGFSKKFRSGLKSLFF